MKRLAPWQLEKQRTAKALRSLPLCEECRIKRGMGFALNGLWLCPTCARASRADAPRES
jgi:ribosomal protein L37AE/L43A